MIKLFCKHEWKELKHFEIPSEAENVYNLNYKVEYIHSFNKSYVTDYTCSKCGKLKRKIIKTK